mgnify:CR=1 FL=1
MNNLIKAIKELKKEKNAIILGHYYQKGEIQISLITLVTVWRWPSWLPRRRRTSL